LFANTVKALGKATLFFKIFSKPRHLVVEQHTGHGKERQDGVGCEFGVNFGG